MLIYNLVLLVTLSINNLITHTFMSIIVINYFILVPAAFDGTLLGNGACTTTGGDCLPQRVCSAGTCFNSI